MLDLFRKISLALLVRRGININQPKRDSRFGGLNLVVSHWNYNILGGHQYSEQQSRPTNLHEPMCVTHLSGSPG